MSETDLQLLARYSKQHAEDAFAEIVRRHLNLVHSAALRQVRSPQLAEEVSQSVFVDLARQAEKLKPDTILTAWLYQITRREAIDVVRRESRRQLREQIAFDMNATDAHAADWNQIEPLLDEAMQALDESDRTAVLLRYFENKSLREIGVTLGTSEDTAQKRVSRAVDRLREFFSKRGVTVGASGLAVVVSANAVYAAPAGLATIISTAAVLAGAAVQTSIAITTAKTIAMTTFQKSLVAVLAVAALGVGFYQAQQNSSLQKQIQTLQQQHALLAENNSRLTQEHEDTTNQLALMRGENSRLKSGQNLNELAKLRGQVGVLRDKAASAESKEHAGGIAKMMNDSAMKEYIHQTQIKAVKNRYGELFDELQLTTEQREKFIQLVADSYLKNSERLSNQLQGKMTYEEMTQSFQDSKSELRDALRTLLGETGYARIEEYNKEIPARSTVALLKDQLGTRQLDENQSAQLFKLVKAEPYELTHGIAGDLDKALMGSSEKSENYLQKIRESNQHVVEQAAAFLTPEQLATFNLVLSNGITARITQAAALAPKR